MASDPSPWEEVPREAAGPSEAVAPLLQRAVARAEEGEWQEMAELLRDALEDHPEDPHVLVALGTAERELGMEGVAYERFKRALAAEPRDPVLLATAGNALAAFDDPGAEAALRTAAMLAPGLPQARWMYGAYLAREGLVAEALEELKAAAELDPESPVIQLELGVAYALGGDLAAASLALARSAERDPGDGWALLLLGLARMEMEEPEDAVPALEEGARLRPWDLEAQLLAALALAATGWDERALEMLERARLQAEGTDAALVLEVEEWIEEGPDSALRFFHRSLGPSSFRERLMQRP